VSPGRGRHRWGVAAPVSITEVAAQGTLLRHCTAERPWPSRSPPTSRPPWRTLSRSADRSTAMLSEAAHSIADSINSCSVDIATPQCSASRRAASVCARHGAVRLVVACCRDHFCCRRGFPWARRVCRSADGHPRPDFARFATTSMLCVRPSTRQAIDLLTRHLGANAMLAVRVDLADGVTSPDVEQSALRSALRSTARQRSRSWLRYSSRRHEREVPMSAWSG
jgi:hypothetical protein